MTNGVRLENSPELEKASALDGSEALGGALWAGEAGRWPQWLVGGVGMGWVCHAVCVVDAVSVGRSRWRLGVAITSVFVAVVGGCGVAVAWRLGLFNSNGRFDDLDACELMPEAGELASLVSDGRREPGASKPRSLLGLGGDTSSECKWSSVPAGIDRPFRTVRVHVQTKHANSDETGPEAAAHVLQNWYDNRVRRGARVTPIKIGERGYGITDQATYVIILARVDVFDIHAKFRVSNAVLDVSARTHDQPGPKEREQVDVLARDVAARLNSFG
ncbi:hypothetical protein [Spirillospora sp. CA-128828]|uniref:hypothetical protein n=1 Tax=Spirillospora sp. CA-128828 TaxID=3240033 RepID=UPI003D93DA53